MGSDFNFAGSEYLDILIQEHTDAFAFVFYGRFVNYLNFWMDKSRDFDILQENLGI